MTWRSTLSLLAAVALLAGPVSAETPAPPKPGPAPAVRVADPVSHANLTVFLLRGKDTVPAGHTFMTLQEALEQMKLIVHETSEVNELSVENVSADVDVFIQSGDIVRGGKQDRLMAMDMVVAPKSGKLPIASFCCESGRWAKRGKEDSAKFEGSVAQAANKDLKLALNSARMQNKVWDEVKKAQDKLEKNVGKPVAAGESPSSYQLTLENKDLQAKLDAYLKVLKPALEGKDDAIGYVIVVNGAVQGAEVYGSAALFKKLWPKLTYAAAVDALSEFQKDKKFEAATAAAVEKFLADAEQGKRSDVAMNPVKSGGQQQLRANANPDRTTGTADARPNPADAPKPGRVRNVQVDNAKSLMLECQDAKIGNAVLHRSYIAK